MSKYFYNKDQVLSPSGWVTIDESFRRGKIQYKLRKFGYCTWCGEKVKKPRKFWCSVECTNQYNLTQPRELRKIVKKRDKRICDICGIKCLTKDTWDLDHIVQISEGGHPFDLENLRILCVPCHKQETIKFMMRRKLEKSS